MMDKLQKLVADRIRVKEKEEFKATEVFAMVPG